MASDMRPTTRRFLVSALALLWVLSACRSGTPGGTEPTPTSPAPSPSPVPSPSPGSEFTVAAAGDICGDCEPTARLVESVAPDLVLTMGDNAYPDGSPSDFETKYDPWWGRFKEITRPSPGNHDWHMPAAAGYRDYFGLGDGPLYYSFDFGGWHFVAMDTEEMDSAQVAFVGDDLAADGGTCEIAYGHHPRWSSGSKHGSSDRQDAVWRALVAGGVDIALFGHDHEYERFSPMDENGEFDAEGTRAFVVGSGGGSLYGFGPPLPTSERRILQHGVIVFTLGDGTYEWQFVGTGGSILDSGSGRCH